ncbi:hypothetical protein TESG_07705 [Trichophyton tonsurans CBS 112818]|uniref:Peptide hydrolase n=1 Tax=Trichophyton tonsurans (strain CBS 112818) TaxID=647933 RepID=F2S9Z6_TRIT1|nr:hypothetical protein TESG_07705 [Trichophyton tonsurans CBS 112818]
MKVLAALALSALAMAKPTPPMPGMSLVQTGPQETRWVTAKEKHDMVMNHIGFFDITNRPETASIASKPKSYAFPGNVSHQAEKIAAGEAAYTLEFHWYAGEEEGLLGSQDIFQQYSQEGKEVVAMLNQDMTGYGETMGIITDNSDPNLTKFTKMILDTYTSAKYADSECGYACSDHASADKAGFPSAFVYEAVFGQDNPAIHSPDDTLDKLDPAKMAEHAKLVVGFAYELAFATL